MALLVIGPERLPEYVARLRQWIRDLKRLADGARTQLRDQMGPEFDDVDWSAYDPRQYDPRRIVREALTETWNSADPEPAPDVPGATSPGASGAAAAGVAGSSTVGAAASSRVVGGAVAAVEAEADTPRERLVTPRYGTAYDPALGVPYDEDAT